MTIRETERLILRRLEPSDYTALCTMLQDAEVMYAYEHAFTDEEAEAWLTRQLDRYEEYGFGLWAVILKSTGVLIGQCGITMQDIGGMMVPEIGYLFAKEYWHRGYAAEASSACREYGFETLGMAELYSIVRENNLPSRRVAERNGMAPCGRIVKHYYGMDMPHILYSVKNSHQENAKSV